MLLTPKASAAIVVSCAVWHKKLFTMFNNMDELLLQHGLIIHAQQSVEWDYLSFQLHGTAVEVL